MAGLWSPKPKTRVRFLPPPPRRCKRNNRKEMMSKQSLFNDLLKSGVLKTPLIISAFEKIDRKDFVPEEFQSEAYEDYPLPIGFGQTISQPWTVAFMLELLRPQPGEKILDIGSGSGYTTTLIAYVVSNKGNPKSESLISKQTLNPESQKRDGKVVALEVIPKLCEFGRQNCEKYGSTFLKYTQDKSLTAGGFVSKGIAKFVCQDGNLGYEKQAPYDKILVSAAIVDVDSNVVQDPSLIRANKIMDAMVEYIPAAWKEQLKIGGRIVCPMMLSVWVFDKISGGEFKEKEYPGFSFVPLV